MNGLKNIHEQVEAKIQTILNTDGTQVFKHRHTWNSQFKDLLGKAGQNKDVSIPFPAIFYTVIIDSIEEQGLYNQLWNCHLELHVAHQLMHSGAEFEQNWVVFDVFDQTHTAFQGWKPDWSSVMVCDSIKQDYNHGNLYEFIARYKFNFEYEYPTSTILYTGATLNLSAVTTTITQI